MGYDYTISTTNDKYLAMKIPDKPVLDTTLCTHPNVIKKEHLTGDDSMEYTEWYDNTCLDCGKKWTTNE